MLRAILISANEGCPRNSAQILNRYVTKEVAFGFSAYNHFVVCYIQQLRRHYNWKSTLHTHTTAAVEMI